MEIHFDPQGLAPAIVQHARTGEVLMLGYMNADALEATRATGLVTFWSRSRQALWRKGETSGHVLRLVDLRVDCDADALLVLAEPAGPTCHTGERSCFHRDVAGTLTRRSAPPGAVLGRLADGVRIRRNASPETSYTARLLQEGVDRIAKKVGEEAVEVVIAAKNASHAELTYELADLLYHIVVLLEDQGLSLEAIWQELERRMKS
ncbi:MAG: bifunctional phosphoribosyl-AMP cyclohydrolase/phosphoribosyl-ATP diphosphatase HisIE [Oscillochloridaceae bacterium]|nr:bifunctional phosphoribosyl-AMP cyclohydrolase/phosphoribosyl-ATP diphosphatase HisIE [Chloroflexaceae bacterium]MDW8390209.1 bifunctional phosphoribosyl-AMP cyclohydrolase/phosphoribosyl-ATP diphosphatase HisIE [Oscillochloridaceae bacterium]